MRYTYRIFGRNDDENLRLLQILMRAVAILATVTIVLASTTPQDKRHQQDACFPRCVVSADRVAEAQAEYHKAQRFASADRIDAPISVVVYGDSRGWFLAEGAKLVPGWNVTNAARQGCLFLAQDRMFEHYAPDGGADERSVSTQSTGETLTCDTRTYLPGPHFDLAIVYAGTLLSVDTGADENIHSPLDPTYADYLVLNLAMTLSSIDADRIIVVDTPRSFNTWDVTGRQFRSDDWLWARQDRIDAVNGILDQAAAFAGVEYLSGFSTWVQSQPDDCQSDGAHFTIDCALAAAQWIRAAI